MYMRFQCKYFGTMPYLSLGPPGDTHIFHASSHSLTKQPKCYGLLQGFPNCPNHPVWDIPNCTNQEPVRFGCGKQSGIPDHPKRPESDRYGTIPNRCVLPGPVWFRPDSGSVQVGQCSHGEGRFYQLHRVQYMSRYGAGLGTGTTILGLLNSSLELYILM